jgi:hypothetical protein
LQGKQVLITCCDPAAFGGMEGGHAFEMRAGMLLAGKETG